MAHIMAFTTFQARVDEGLAFGNEKSAIAEFGAHITAIYMASR